MADPWDWSVGGVVAHIGRHSEEIFGGIDSLPEGRESQMLDRDSLVSKLRNNAIDGRALLCRVNHQVLQMNMGLLLSDQRNAILAIIERLRTESPKYQRFQNPQNTQMGNNGSARPPVAGAPLNASANSTNKERRRVSNLVTEPLNSPVNEGVSTNTETRRVSNLATRALDSGEQRVVPQAVPGEGNAGMPGVSVTNDTEGDGVWDYLAERWNVADDDDDEIISIGDEDDKQDEELDDMEAVEDDSIMEPVTEGPVHGGNGQTSGGNKLSDDEVLGVIHSYIDEYTAKWTPGKHADEVLDQAWDAHELWHELHDQKQEEQGRVIRKTKEQIEYYELRVNVIIQEIIESKLSWTNAATLRRQCRSLDLMLDWLEQEKWELDVYEMPSPPPKIDFAETLLPAGPGRTSGSTVQAQLNQLSNRAIGQDDFVLEQIVESDGPQPAALRNQELRPPVQRPDPAPRPGPGQVEVIDLGSASDRDSNSSEMDVDEFHTPLSRRAPTEQLNPLPLRPVSGDQPIVSLPWRTVTERTAHSLPMAQPTIPAPRAPRIRPIPLPTTHSTPSEPMIIDSDPDPAPVPLSSPPAVLPSVEAGPTSTTLPSIPFPRSINTQHRIRPTIAPMVLTPPPALPSTHPVTMSPSTASYATISRWTWPDLLAASDRKRIVLKVLQEMGSADREIIRARTTTVKKADLVREITECVGMMVRGAQGIRGCLARDVAKIVKFTRLFFCWWLAGDYFVHDGDGDGDVWGAGAWRKEIPGWRLRELEQCLRDGETEDPRVFCEWVRWVMERTFSKEALERLWAPSQAEVIVISDDEG